MEQMADTQPILGRIYKITSSQTDACYIGSTTKTLTHRFSQHKNDYTLHLKGKRYYNTSFHLLQHSDANIELVYEGLFDTKRDMERMEGHYINNTPNAVNKKGAGMTKEEIFIKFNTRVTCELCGITFTRCNKWNHNRSKKHGAALQNLDQEQFHSASSTQTPEDIDDEISSESFYHSAASSS